MVNGAWSQTIVFEKNKETAIYHAKKGISTIKFEVVTFKTALSNEKFQAIGDLLAEKDGYVQIEKLNDLEMRLEFESWLNLDDFYSLLIFHGFLPKQETLEHEAE